MAEPDLTHAAIGHFVELTDRESERKVLVRKSQVVAAYEDAGGSVLLLAAGGEVRIAEAPSKYGLQFHNSATVLHVNGAPTGQVQIRTGFVGVVKDNGDGTTTLHLVGGHVVVSALSMDRWGTFLEQTEHPEAARFNYPHWQ